MALRVKHPTLFRGDNVDVLRGINADAVDLTYLDPPCKTHRHTLCGQQEGHCAGCRIHFRLRHRTVDHIVPRWQGGTDHLDHLQLQCHACNSRKGTIDPGAFVAQLTQQGIR